MLDKLDQRMYTIVVVERTRDKPAVAIVHGGIHGQSMAKSDVATEIAILAAYRRSRGSGNLLLQALAESLEGRPTAETRYTIARLVTAAQAVVSEGGWNSHKTAAESAIGCSGCAMCELKAALAALNGEGG